MDGWEKIPKNTRIVSRYQLGADTTVMISGKKQQGRLVRARSQSKFGTGSAGFIFVDSLGFVEIENEINGITTRMRLIEVMWNAFVGIITQLKKFFEIKTYEKEWGGSEICNYLIFFSLQWL